MRNTLAGRASIPDPSRPEPPMRRAARSASSAKMPAEIDTQGVWSACLTVATRASSLWHSAPPANARPARRPSPEVAARDRVKASKARSPVYAIAVESPWGGKSWTPWRRESSSAASAGACASHRRALAFARVTPLGPPR